MIGFEILFLLIIQGTAHEGKEDSKRFILGIRRLMTRQEIVIALLLGPNHPLIRNQNSTHSGRRHESIQASRSSCRANRSAHQSSTIRGGRHHDGQNKKDGKKN